MQPTSKPSIRGKKLLKYLHACMYVCMYAIIWFVLSCVVGPLPICQYGSFCRVTADCVAGNKCVGKHGCMYMGKWYYEIKFSSALLSYFFQSAMHTSLSVRQILQLTGYNLAHSYIHTYIQRAFYILKKRAHINDLFVQTSGCKANFGVACVSSSECCDPGVRHHHSFLNKMLHLLW